MSYIIYGVAAAIALGLKYIHTYLSIDYLLFILKPVASLVEKAMNSPFDYYPELGYVSDKLSVVIGRECAGINFFIVIFLMLTISFAAKVRGRKDKPLLMTYFLAVSYIVTIIANASRIITSILVLRLGIAADIKQAVLLHQSVGVIFYFVYLACTYYLFSYLIKRMEVTNEEFI